MLKNYFIITFRNMFRHKSYSAINIGGLAVGLASLLLIVIFIRNETGYDVDFADSDRMYRSRTQSYFNNSANEMAVSPSPMARTLMADYPEVEVATRVYDEPLGELVVKVGDKRYIEKEYFFVDSTFFQVFSYTMAAGQISTSLTEPNTVVLTHETAQKYFGSIEVIGEFIEFEDDLFRVTGVLAEDQPKSHLSFGFLASIVSIPEVANSNRWASAFLYTYFKLYPNVETSLFVPKLENILYTYMSPQIEAFTGMTYAQFKEKGNSIRYWIQPVTDIHLKTNVVEDISINGDYRNVVMFMIIGIITLLIAGINFTNLTTARYSTRAKEVGLRKVVGSTRGNLIFQFLTESVTLSIFAALIAGVIVEISRLPFLNAIGLDVARTVFWDGSIIAILLGSSIALGLLAGMYPAFYLSSFQPVAIMRGMLTKGTAGRRLRSVLVVMQFTVSGVLIIGTLIVRQQLEHIQSQELGFDGEQVMVISRANQLGDQFDAFRNTILANPTIVNATAATSLPGYATDSWLFKERSAPKEESEDMRTMRIDYNFVETLGMKIILGRAPDASRAADAQSIVINRRAMEVFGWDDPIGKEITYSFGEVDTYAPIVGVVENFNQASLHEEIRPIVMRLTRERIYAAVKITGADVRGTVAAITHEWESLTNGTPMEYTFLDERFAALYRTEIRLGNVFGAFSILAILIASLGLFGLATYTVERRTKEIGIRKVLGASVTGIISLLSGDFVKLVIVANLIAWPIAWYAMGAWLQNFAYRVDLTMGVFIIAGLLGAVIAFITVSTQSLRAATSNPVDALRYE